MGTSLVAPVRADVFCTQSNDGHDGAGKRGSEEWRTYKTYKMEHTLGSEFPGLSLGLVFQGVSFTVYMLLQSMHRG